MLNLKLQTTAYVKFNLGSVGDQRTDSITTVTSSQVTIHVCKTVMMFFYDYKQNLLPGTLEE